MAMATSGEGGGRNLYTFSSILRAEYFEESRAEKNGPLWTLLCCLLGRIEMSLLELYMAVVSFVSCCMPVSRTSAAREERGCLFFLVLK